MAQGRITQGFEVQRKQLCLVSLGGGGTEHLDTYPTPSACGLCISEKCITVPPPLGWHMANRMVSSLSLVMAL